MEEYHERKHERTDFQRDYDRLIFSSPFRRLQNKTQVFPLPGSIFVHNRLTHSLEVSCVGRSLGNNVAKGLMQKYPEGSVNFPRKDYRYRGSVQRSVLLGWVGQQRAACPA